MLESAYPFRYNLHFVSNAAWQGFQHLQLWATPSSMQATCESRPAMVSVLSIKYTVQQHEVPSRSSLNQSSQECAVQCWGSLTLT